MGKVCENFDGLPFSRKRAKENTSYLPKWYKVLSIFKFMTCMQYIAFDFGK